MVPTLADRTKCFLRVCLVLGSSLGLAEAEGRLSWQISEEGVLVQEADQKVLFYQKQPKAENGRYMRANYVHPLYDLKGEVLTEDFPADHRHHRGIFWAWHQLWLGDQQLGDAWTTQDFLAKVQTVEVIQPEDPLKLRLLTKVNWTSNRLKDDKGEAIPVVEERATITVHARKPAFRLVDFEIQLKALKPGVKLGGSDDEKGYGGFSARVKLSPETRLRGTHGPVEPQTGAVKAGPWMDFSTPQTGVAILDHPANPGYPQPWILRGQRSMQNSAYPGREPVAVSQAKPLLLKYRLVIHDGSLDQTALDALQQAWAKSASP
jgi:Family of unknown function (DUF6807)